MKRRVVVTGMAGISPIGNDWQSVRTNLRELKNGVTYMKEWDRYVDLGTRLAAPAAAFELPKHYNKKILRSMGRVSILATRASEMAIEDAGLLGHEILSSGSTGVAYGSSAGSPPSLADFASMMDNYSMKGIKASSYIKMMPHTTSTNIGIFFGLQGRVIPTSSACTSGSLAIGFAYEAIQDGKQTVMISGGAEELSVTEAAVFDTLYATSTQNHTPNLSPRPFDAERDGLVIGEGAGTIILEDLVFALSRGANIKAEVIGFGTNSDGNHFTQPTSATMKVAMELALKDANLRASDIGYINAHATATDTGDVAESLATEELFGSSVPVSTLKSYMGHTLGAAGSLEAWMSIEMMNEGWFAPNLNLKQVDPKCGKLNFIMDKILPLEVTNIMSNNFAFGGVNTSLIFRRWDPSSNQNEW